jgi:hypothetical protein
MCLKNSALRHEEVWGAASQPCRYNLGGGGAEGAQPVPIG